MKRRSLSLIHMQPVYQLQPMDMAKTSPAFLQHLPMVSSGSAESTYISQAQTSVDLKPGECRVTFF